MSPAFALYGGYNYSQNPVPDQWAMINVPAPAIVLTTPRWDWTSTRRATRKVTLGYYHAFENSGTGSIFGPTGLIPGSSVTNTLMEDSVQLMFSYVSWGQI
ncbi:MAG: hypothetical protein O7E49_03880 [Gemmatimonadetes bacterium]|nr:hypothetical protein [Gemmatimonadota bacterium]